MKMVRDRPSSRYLFDKKYKVSLSTMEDWKVSRAHLPSDGDNWSTVLQTEIAATLQCAREVHDYDRDRNIRICPVSRAAITTLDHLDAGLEML